MKSEAVQKVGQKSQGVQVFHDSHSHQLYQTTPCLYWAWGCSKLKSVRAKDWSLWKAGSVACAGFQAELPHGLSRFDLQFENQIRMDSESRMASHQKPSIESIAGT